MGIRACRLACFAVTVAALAASCGDNLTPEPDPDEVVAIRLDTVAPAQVAAGDTIGVACTLYENDITTMVPAEIRVVDEAKIMRVQGTVVARTVGTIQVSCALPDRGIVDVTPATVEIVAGPAANVVTTVTPNPVVAGNDVTATCEVYDGFGNPILDGPSPTLELAPIDAANTVVDLTATMIRSGHYIATCQLPGTTSNNAGFDVLPNLPASIVLAKLPDLPVYAINHSIQITHVIYDRYGNEVPAATVSDFSTDLTGAGPTTSAGNTTYRYGSEGSYRITVSVDPPTDMGTDVSASVDVIVNSRGPAIVCDGDATMLNMTPGSTLVVSGSANDINGVASIAVNGTPVPVGPGGSFSAPIATRFGMNFVDVTATDAFGEPTVKVCTFLVSNRYFDPNANIADTVALELTQGAVDDGNRSGALGSFGDLLHTVVNSQGLRDAVHAALSASNPLKPSSCDSQTCTFFGCVCWYSSQVRYLSSQFDGPHTVQLALVNGGIAATARFENVHVRLRVDGKVGPIPYDSSGWVNVSYLEIKLTLDTALVNGRPHMTVRGGSVSASVGSITTDFDGVDGWIIDHIVVPLAQGTLRNALQGVIQSYVVNNFNAVLDGLLSNLDISTLGATFNVPRLGGGSLAMQFGLGFSALDTNASRLLFGIGTKFTTPPANGFPSLGVALPPGTNLSVPSVGSPNNTGVAVHVGVINGALHALWRGNYFAMTIAGSQLGGGIPATVNLDVTTRLPPVAYIDASNIVRLHLGAVDLTVQHPNLPPNLAVRLGAEAHASVTLVGNDLVFGGITIDAIHASTDALDLTAQAQQSLQTLLVQVAQQLVDQSLNSSLPALPIPGFTIPPALGTYGLPVGSVLGVNSPSLSIAPQHFTLRGQLGLH